MHSAVNCWDVLNPNLCLCFSYLALKEGQRSEQSWVRIKFWLLSDLLRGNIWDSVLENNSRHIELVSSWHDVILNLWILSFVWDESFEIDGSLLIVNFFFQIGGNYLLSGKVGLALTSLYMCICVCRFILWYWSQYLCSSLGI